MSEQEILIIDDDQAQHEILGEHLRLAGFTPLHADNSDEGLALLQGKDVDLILLDINMPKVDGFQTIEILRNQQRTCHIPVLFLTSLDRQYLKIKGLELGADDYVTKPYNSAELIARIKAILRRSKPRVAGQESELSGDVQAIGLGDLLQNLGHSSRTAQIVLPDMDGEIIVSGAEVVSARQGTYKGTEALLRLLLLERGRFSVSYQDIADLENGLGIPIVKVLLTTANQVDQITLAVEETGHSDPILELVAESSGDSAIDLLTERFPCRFFALAEAMEGPIEENINKVLQAIQAQKIRCQAE